MARKDPWQDRRYVMTLHPKSVDVLYMTRKDMEAKVKAGDVSESDWKRYWVKGGVQHLEEVAVILDSDDWAKLKAWAKTWGHKGGSFYLREGFAVRAGGANQRKDPLNVFFLED